MKYSYYIGNQRDEIDKRMKMLKLPNSISRTLRPIKEKEYYRAHEWKYLLLFAAYPVLYDILNNR